MLRKVLFVVPWLLMSLFSSAPLIAAEGADEKVALVTGANRGIGLEFAEQLQAAGYKVIGTARKPREAADLRALGVQVEQLDVADGDSVRALAERLKSQPIDLLINNAGISGHAAPSFEATDFDQVAHTFEVNSLGPMRVTQALLPNLEAGSDKAIVGVTSIMGSLENSGGGYYGYRASKAALNMFKTSLSSELGPRGYTIVLIHPGWVQTRMGGDSAPVPTAESVAGMVAVILELEPKDNGGFVDYQGEPLPW